jgi:hypothetical protein
MSNDDYEVTYGPCGTVKSIRKRGESSSSSSSSKSFHTGGSHHDTYANQARYVAGLGNRWASENFEATRPYFA